MIYIKTPNEISIMRVGGRILGGVLSRVLSEIKPGVSELELDRLAEKLVLQKGGTPGFKKVEGYRHTICISTNDVVVHGVPTNYKLKEGDVVGVDCGVYYKRFYTDAAHTVRVQSFPRSGISPRETNLKSQKDDEVDKFLETGERAMWEGIKEARAGNRVGHISKAIQKVVEGQGYSVVRSLIGHGVGRKLHEEPEVPGFLSGKIENTPKLVEGMTIAIEVIYNMGKSDVVYANNDGWSIKTKDRSLSGLFERTVAITKDGPEVLTQ